MLHFYFNCIYISFFLFLNLIWFWCTIIRSRWSHSEKVYKGKSLQKRLFPSLLSFTTFCVHCCLFPFLQNQDVQGTFVSIVQFQINFCFNFFKGWQRHFLNLWRVAITEVHFLMGLFKGVRDRFKNNFYSLS